MYSKKSFVVIPFVLVQCHHGVELVLLPEVEVAELDAGMTRLDLDDGDSLSFEGGGLISQADDHSHSLHGLIGEQTRDVCLHDLGVEKEILSSDGDGEDECSFGWLGISFTKPDDGGGGDEPDQLLDLVTHPVQVVIGPLLSAACLDTCSVKVDQVDGLPDAGGQLLGEEDGVLGVVGLLI